MVNNNINKGKPWSRDELLIAFNLYCRISFGQIDRNNKKIIEIAGLLRRSPNAVAMKLANFASLDPYHRARSVNGLSNISKLDKLIWQEFYEDWEGLAFESQKAIEAVLEDKTQGAVDVFDYIPFISKSEGLRMTRIRLVQHFFREAVLTSYQHRCAVCKISIPELLNASHIIPWSKNKKRRADPTNGISLCTLHDRAFDRGLITFDENYKLVISERLRYYDNVMVVKQCFHSFENQPLDLPSRFRPDRKALKYHRKFIFCK